MAPVARSQFVCVRAEASQLMRVSAIARVGVRARVRGLPLASRRSCALRTPDTSTAGYSPGDLTSVCVCGLYNPRRPSASCGQDMPRAGRPPQSLGQQRTHRACAADSRHGRSGFSLALVPWAWLFGALSRAPFPACACSARPHTTRANTMGRGLGRALEVVVVATSQTRKERIPMLGRRRKRAHRVATIPREGGTVAVVAATMMTPMIPRRAVIRPCLS